MLIPYSSPTPIVTISVMDGVKFYVHKTIMTENSEYFAKALNGPFLEGSTQSIDLDDVLPGLFGRYVNTMYLAVLSPLTAEIAPYNVESCKCHTSQLQNCLRHWQLADRFLDSKMMAIAEKSINFISGDHLSVDRWTEDYIQNDEHLERFWARFVNLQSAFYLCKEESIPFQEHMVTALANCPAQVFAEHVERLEEGFRTAVTKAFALPHVDRRTLRNVKKQIS